VGKEEGRMTDRANDIDVTAKVQIDWINDEFVGISRCVCGKQVDFTLDTERDDPNVCNACCRALYVRQVTQIFEAHDAPASTPPDDSRCPICGAEMVLLKPRPNDDFDPFLGCIDYPECDGKRPAGPQEQDQ
jgi:hypothetical protein